MSRVPADAEKCPKCGIQFENTNPGGALPNGWVLGERYTIGRYNDIDGEGVTYSAIDGNTLQRVTIKEFMPVTLCATRDETGAIQAKPGNEVLFKTTRMDFSDLYASLLRLGLVEGLVQVLDVFDANNTAYAVLEKVEGPTLAEYLTKMSGSLEPGRALSILRPVMNGVETMHAANLVHRGISPENIILESGGTAKLGGYATLALRQQGSELKPKLYPGFSAPEQYAASEFEGQYTDVYAFGAVLYRMLTDEVPYPADERKMQDALQPARAVNKEIPAVLSAAIGRSMRVVPAERIQNIPDLRLALSGEGGRGAKGPLGLTKQQLIIGATALGVVVVLLLVILFISLFSRGGADDSSSVTSSSASISMALQVPDFTGQKYTDVINDEKYDEYTFATPEEEYSLDVEEGRIISQDPKSGTTWDGSPIKLVVSKGQLKMPNLVGKKVEDAKKQLDEMELSYTEVEYANPGDLEAGTVAKTTPVADTPVLPGETTVTLYVVKASAEVEIPDMYGDTQAMATSRLTALGIKYTIQYVTNDLGPHMTGTVAGTDPVAGNKIQPDSTTITLKIFDKYYMPNLQGYVGKSASELTAFLDGRHIQYSLQTVANDGTHTAGTVASVTQPPVNSEVTTSTVVTIYVYGDAPAPPTPTSTPENP